jgi:antitoxin (DNA-binding transcriptional repressor) of toxin-antitoxin stability system
VRDPFPTPSGPAALALVAGATLLARSELAHGVLAAVVAGFDLVVHEAGHPIFGLLGSRFLMFLGGTLAQLAFPVAALVAFAARRQPASFAAAAVWLGVNLVNVGRYAADGDARVLPLLAADADSHDWWNMLGMLGLRGHAPAVGGAIGLLGWALHLAAPGWALVRWLTPRLDAAATR